MSVGDRTYTLAGGAALVALLLLSAALSYARGASAEGGIDIGGEWTFFIQGEFAASCSVAIEQDGDALTADASCAGLGAGSLAGEIDGKTGAFSLTGQLVGMPVGLAGAAAEDGRSLAGYWSAELLGLSGTFTAARAEDLPTATPLPTLPEPVDLTGTWEIEFFTILSGSCTSLILQENDALLSAADCDLVGALALEGTIDQTNGSFTVEGDGISLSGVASADGNELSGTFDAFSLVSGTFTAARVSEEILAVDTSGAWTFLFRADASEVLCAGAAVHDFFDWSATLDCGTGEPVFFTGTAHPLTGSVWASGQIAGQSVEFGAEVQPGRVGTGWWYAPEEPLELAELFVIPSDQAGSGVIAIDCFPSATLERSCSAPPGSAHALFLQVILPPSDGYTGFHVTIVEDGRAQYDESVPVEVLWGGCAPLERVVARNGERVEIEITCGPSAGAGITGNVIGLQFECSPLVRGTSIIGISPDGTSFSTAEGEVTPSVLSATLRCDVAGSGGGARYDVNCDGVTNSIDAALVLQLDAGLLTELSCGWLGDATGDGELNSADAAVILQYVAGLV